MRKTINYLITVKENTSNILRNAESESVSLQQPEFEKQIKELEVGRLIGIGNFSVVCAGSRWRMEEKDTPGGYEAVAVKIPRMDVGGEGSDVQREISIMKHLGKHKFVLELICTVEAQQVNARAVGIHIVTQFCINGTLKNYLRVLNSKEFEQEFKKEDLSSEKRFEAMKFSYQIVSGMDFISSKNIIHGDLATRNVLLDERKICKISDFGFSRQLSSDVMETGEWVNVKDKPWRWMAPEFLDGWLTPSSDVWSFGVTLWEIFTFGQCPFRDNKMGQEFKEGIRDGRIRLAKPDMADEEIFDIMKKCWTTEYKQRPSFSFLLDFFWSRYNLFKKRVSPLKRQQIEDYQPTKIKPHLHSSTRSEEGIKESSSEKEIPNEEFHFDDLVEASESTCLIRRAHVNGKIAAVKISERHQDFTYKYGFSQALNEAKILTTVGEHPFIVGFIGACTNMISKGLVYVAFEFCANGTLVKYLRSLEKKECSLQDETFFWEELTMIVSELARFSWEIASAMSYLSGKEILHNQLAAENVLLDENKTCKLSDFSLSCGLDSIKKLDKWTGKPPNWEFLAPEVFHKMKFSKESDVWAYGVTLWEIFRLGQVLRKEDSPWLNEVEDLGRNVFRPKPEALMSKQVYEKMVECWELDAKQRPNFESLSEFFKVLSGDKYYFDL